MRGVGGDEYVVEEQEKDEEARGGQQGRGQAADPQPDATGPVRAVREVAKLHAVRSRTRSKFAQPRITPAHPTSKGRPASVMAKTAATTAEVKATANRTQP